jgi:glycosyltransferase involved in cell wall biosynthesis
MSKIKVLTSVRVAQTAGIAQVVFSFLDFVEKSKRNDINIVAVDIINRNKKAYKRIDGKKTSVISISTKLPNIARVVDTAKNLEEVKQKYETVIGFYQKAIQEEKPDLVLINGTYFMPWCLLMASERENVPAVIHYHGVLTKEVQNWKKHQRKIFLEMERCFDKKDLFYIFPSKITKNIVEKEVFCHKIKKCSILANPVSMHFFTEKNTNQNILQNRNIGMVSRWTGIKNVNFFKKLAEYNHRKGTKFVINIVTDLNVKHKEYIKLSKLVKFHKPRSNKKLALFYRKMGVVISPSHFETYGNVAKEALASGTPAMVNANMGVSEAFNNLGLSDWVIDFNSVKSVYNKIDGVIGKTVHKDIKDEMKNLYMPCTIFNQMISILSNASNAA